MNAPKALRAIEYATRELGFQLGSDRAFGALLKELAASKPKSALLELGTGTGIATSWLLDGMDGESSLLSIDRDEAVSAVARDHLGSDPRVRFVLADGEDYLRHLVQEGRSFALIFADAWAGKYHHLDEALQLLEPDGLYVVDDLNPQPNWPEDHAPKVARLIETLEARPDLEITKHAWSTGIIIARKARRANGRVEG